MRIVKCFPGLFTVLALVVLPCVVAWGVTYSGELEWEEGLAAQGTWAALGTKIKWEITDKSTPGNSLWGYRYVLTVSDDPDPSHMIVEVTPNVFSLMEVAYDPDGSPTIVEIGEFDPTSDDKKPYPYLPESVYGVKFDDLPDSGGSIGITFDSPNSPVWHNFYAVGGSPTHPNFGAVWNKGFLLGIPDDGPGISAEQANWHILGPNSPGGGGYIPEPLTVLGLAMGLTSVGTHVLRRRRRQVASGRE